MNLQLKMTTIPPLLLPVSLCRVRSTLPAARPGTAMGPAAAHPAGPAYAAPRLTSRTLKVKLVAMLGVCFGGLVSVRLSK